jgi:hypothetical protein
MKFGINSDIYIIHENQILRLRLITEVFIVYYDDNGT